MGTRLFIGNLAYSVTEQDLRDAFSSEGIEVRSVKVALDRESGRPRGFAFVETMTDDGAKLSIEKLSGRVLQGRSIVLEEAQARTGPGGGPRPSGPGGGGGYGGAPRPGGYGGPPGGPRPGGFGGGPGGGPGGPPRPGGFGGPPRPGGFGGPPRPGGFGGPPRPGAGFGGPPAPAGDKPRADRPERRDRPEKKRSTRPKPEDSERGNWRFTGNPDDYDE